MMFRYYLIVLLVVTICVLNVVSATNAVVNIGTSSAGNVAAFSGTDGASVTPSTSLTITSTNAALIGNLTGNGGVFTNTLTLGGVAVSTATAANPTGTIGLSAVNGSASTFPRSDSAPALPSTSAFQGNVLVPWIGTDNAFALKWKKRPQVWECFSSGDWNQIAVNTGSGTFAVVPVDTVEMFIWSATTGSATNSVGGFQAGGGQNIATFGTNNCAFLARIKTPTVLSTDADGYEIVAGFADLNSNASPTDGAYVYYQHSASTSWLGRTANNTSVTTATGGGTMTVSADTWYDLVGEGNNTTVNFWASSNDGQSWTFLGASTANIPSATTRAFTCQVYIRKLGGSVGTTVRVMYMGRFEFWPNIGN